MANQVNATARDTIARGAIESPADHGFGDGSFVPDRLIRRRSPLRGAAIAQKAGGHRSEAIVPGRDHRPPGRTGTARPWQEHDRRTGTLFLIVDGAT